jgi:hypothetical protein
MPKILFIDSTPEIDRTWKLVHGADDIPIKVNIGPNAEADIRRRIRRGVVLHVRRGV